MSNWQAYFDTDWQAMTTTDWIGLMLTVLIFLALAMIFYWALTPKNKQRLESYRHLPFEETDAPREAQDER